jgi:Asp-tRNA(Asn)/Glu-tRNA(Gln) amidotransferase A subunit family amidase
MPPHRPSRPRHAHWALGAALLPALLGAQPARPAGARPVPPPRAERGIAELRRALQSGRLSCRTLVEGYLARIARYDQAGPAINSLVVIHPRARALADSLDAVQRTGAPLGALHCMPLIVKDNLATHDLPTTAGSLALAGWVPTRDATMVARVRAAGAIVLAKANLAEWAFTPYETVSSILPGYTRNPYALDRVTAGSSGGTAAAVAASLGVAGLGTDTGNSIRGPSAHQALVGIRSTMGLTSRAGVVPLNLGADIAGPMARTMADAVELFQVVAGADPLDPVTADAGAHRAADYRDALRPDGLRGARIGVLRQAYERPTLDSAVARVFTRAVADLRTAGATVLDSVRVDSLDAILRRQQGGCNPFARDLAAFFRAWGPAPVATVGDVVASGKYHPTVQLRLQQAQGVAAIDPDTTAGCRTREAARAALRTAVTRLMDSLRLDALVYPTWSNPPRKIGDLNTPHGDNSQLFAPMTGFPALTVPMGVTYGALPAGITFFGRAWSEARLITLGYGYEQATRHRRPPAGMP